MTTGGCQIDLFDVNNFTSHLFNINICNKRDHQLKALGILIILSQPFSLSRRSSQAESRQSKTDGWGCDVITSTFVSLMHNRFRLYLKYLVWYLFSWCKIIYFPDAKYSHDLKGIKKPSFTILTAIISCCKNRKISRI